MISITDAAALLAAGAVAGLLGSAGGITSLVSYPALLAVGLPALAANVANNVALVACWPGSALGSRPELVGKGRWLSVWAPVAAAGGAAGAGLLLATSSAAFARIVPFLVATGSLALLLEPRLTSWREQRAGGHGRAVLAVGLVLLSIYNGYFGAGSGVMILTLLLVLVDPHLARANALKNMLLGAAVAVSATLYVLFATVKWSAVVPLAVGLFIGSRLGPVVARRLPAVLLRRLIAVLGLALAVELWLHPAA
jgi:uncharacterized membrane protein YfcA